MAFKIVQNVTAVDVPTVDGVSTSVPIAMKTGYLRIAPTQHTYIEVGANPGVNSTTSLWVPGGTDVVLKQEWGSKNFVGILTGATTTVIFPEGTGNGFNVGDSVALTGASPAGLNTTFATVATVDERMSYDSFMNTRLTLNWNTSAFVGIITTPNGELRKVTRVAAYNAGSGASRIHITEIQVNSYS